MGLLETVLGPITNLVDGRKSSKEMSRFRMMHQWPIVLGIVSILVTKFLGANSGLEATLVSWGLPAGALAEYVTYGVFFAGSYFLTVFNRKAGKEQSVAQE